MREFKAPVSGITHKTLTFEKRPSRQNIAHQKSTPQMAFWTLSGISKRLLAMPVAFSKGTSPFEWIFTGMFRVISQLTFKGRKYAWMLQPVRNGIFLRFLFSFI